MIEFDQHDYQRLAVEVFRQALDDYKRLQFPSMRSRKYMHETWLEAVDMFWDPEYRLEAFTDDNKAPMDLRNFMMLASDRSNLDIEALYKYLKQESFTYWENKLAYTMSTPDVIMVCEVPYNILHSEQPSYRIDYDTRTIFVDKRQTDLGQENFITAILEIICFHEDIRMAASARKIIGAVLTRTLKRNGHFIADESTFVEDR